MRRLRKSAILAAAVGVAVLQVASAESRGPELFDGLCNRCHGFQGEGVKGLEAPLIAGMPAWYIEAQLKKFREGARGMHPKDMPGMRMRPMARTLQDRDLPDVAGYVATMPAQTVAATLDGANVAHGKEVFNSAGCTGCHGADAMGNQAMGAPKLAGQSDWYLLNKLQNFKDGIRGGDAAKDPSGAMMRGMAASLVDEASMKDVAAYLHSLPGH